MRSVAVVMVDSAPKHSLEVAAVEDQQPVEAFGAHGADEAFGDRVRFRCSHGRADNLDAFASEDSVEVTRELVVAITERKRTGFDRSLSVQASWRASWVTQPPPGFVVQPARCTRRLPSSMKKSTYSRCSRMVSTVKKSTASMLCACARRN
jgi:hypothetical protein